MRTPPFRSPTRRYELHMLASFLLVITSFWILKPLRKALFVEHYDARGLAIGGFVLSAAQAELCAKLVQVALALVLAFAFATLARRRRRQALVNSVGGAFALAFCGLAAWAPATHAAVVSSSFVWTFYSAGDAYATVMVAALFACMNDVAAEQPSARSYGVIGLGAVLGGVIGSQIVSTWLDALPLRAWLGIAGLCSLAAAWLVARAPMPARTAAPQADLAPAAPQATTAAAAPYVLALALLVGLYEVISTLLDYQFTATLAHKLDGAAIGRQMSRAFVLMNVVALFVQALVTPTLLERRGAQAALLCLPFTLLCASLGLAVFPSVPMASLVPALDSGFAYSLHQSAKERSYVPLARDTKYGAKALVDVLVSRGGKALGIVISLGAAMLAQGDDGMRWLALVTFALVLPFGACALYVTRRSESLSDASAAMRRPVMP